MMSRLWMLMVLIQCTLTNTGSSYDNITNWKKGFGRNGLENILSQDKYMLDVGKSCHIGSWYGCFKKGVSSVILDVMNSARNHEENEGITLIETLPPSKQHVVDKTSTSSERSIIESGFLGFLSRASDHFFRTTGLIIDLNDEVTENGLYQPKFIDEIYSEIDTLEDKNAKPNRRHEFKKLFIPLLVILKIFKLKLLMFLPLILGLASFKKIIALLIIIIPGIIGYLKLCKPDLGNTYGTYGHSSFYNSPPSVKRKRYEELMQQSLQANEAYAHQMAYQSYSRNG